MSNSPPRKPDFSSVRGRVSSTESSQRRPDFGNASSRVASTEELLGDPGQLMYTVTSGDTLSRIAKRHYGKASKWRAIFEANRDQLEDPDRIFPGQVLKIPDDPA